MKHSFAANPLADPDFIPPCLGNGFLGARAGRLLLSPDAYLPVVGTELYDDGIQLELSSPLMAEITVAGIPYRPEQGAHRASLELCTASGEIRLTDRWEYAAGKYALLQLTLLIPRPCRRFLMLDCSIEADAEIRLTQALALPPEPRFDVQEIAWSDNAVVHRCRTRRDRIDFTQELRWASDAAPLSEQCGEKISFVAGNTLQLSFQMAVNCEFPTLSPAELRRNNRREWTKLWSTALTVAELSEERSDQLELFQYQLLANINTAGTVCGPLGVSAIGWNGNQFWDSDLYLFRPLLKLWPEFARSILQYRLNTLPAARAEARSQNLPGALFGFKCDDKGVDRTPGPWRHELHINCWIALAAVEFANNTGDRSFLVLADEIAAMLYRRGEFDAEGGFHLRNLIGPDELVAERDHTVCSDNYLTNCAAALILERSDREEHRRAARAMYYPPEDPETGIRPACAGYRGAEIKQADFILCLYPLGLKLDAKTAEANIEYYNRRTHSGGPMMTTGIECAILAMLGRKDQALERLFRDSEPFVHGTFRVVCETRNNGKSCFLTGIGAFLHGLLAICRPEFTERIYR